MKAIITTAALSGLFIVGTALAQKLPDLPADAYIPYIVNLAGGDEKKATIAKGKLRIEGVSDANIQSAINNYSKVDEQNFKKTRETTILVEKMVFSPAELAQALIDAGVITKDQIIQSIVSQRGL